MDTGSKSLTGQQVTSSDLPACTTACTRFPKTGHESNPGGVSKADSKRLEAMAADGELRAVVDAWADLPETLRAGIVAMVVESMEGSR